ncbi:transposase [Paracidovorax anthurii]|uniref:Mutator family transposase n=1 Tax=Paracidovorax anthurii TaxID=78229 RepID=A0A328YBQ2_9BURK|nr:mutator family transposase [Paracidovorax anthurii]
MPVSKTKLRNAAITAKSAALLVIPKELRDPFVTGPMTGEAVNVASMAFKKALIERALGSELGHHMGYPSGADKPESRANQRDGRSGKIVLTEDGPLRIDVSRDRDGSFEPLLIAKHERRFIGFDDKIVAMYAAWHDGARDPCFPGRAVRQRGLARVHQQRHRRGDSRGRRRAGPPA